MMRLSSSHSIVRTPSLQAPVEIGVARLERRVEREPDPVERRVGGGDECGFVHGAMLGCRGPFAQSSRAERHTPRCYVNFNSTVALRAALIVAMLAGVAACGIKGPLRPPPKAVATPPPPPIDNPAIPPATTSPALPPPSSHDRTQAVSGFAYVDGELRAEDVPLSAVAAALRHAVLRVFARAC